VPHDIKYGSGLIATKCEVSELNMVFLSKEIRFNCYNVDVLRLPLRTILSGCYTHKDIPIPEFNSVISG
jgi:hypothetical protein